MKPVFDQNPDEIKTLPKKYKVNDSHSKYSAKIENGRIKVSAKLSTIFKFETDGEIDRRQAMVDNVDLIVSQQVILFYQKMKELGICLESFDDKNQSEPPPSTMIH